MDYVGKTAVVTGAGSGIGRALAIELARRGASVAMSDVNLQGLDGTAARCDGADHRIRTYELDVADRAAMLAHADTVANDFGAVHLMVNNAGVAVSASVEEMTFEDLDWLLGINLYGVLNGSKAFLPHLIASGDGHLVNISSVFGFIAPPTQSAYSTAKFGVRGFTEALRQEMIANRRPVKVHCVHPGGIKTNIVVNGRMREEIGPSGRDLAADFNRIAMTTPEKAATTILRGVDRNSARILIGPDARVLDLLPRVLGSGYETLLAYGARLGMRRR
jgi:NAD(P)-dependent dehydrogenase (short-subunit alcohol dehydrogenase family)